MLGSDTGIDLIDPVSYTHLGVSEMIARILVSLYAVPAFGFLGVCFGDPLAWVAADLFLIPAFLYVYKKIKKRLDDEKVSVSAV